MTIFIGGGGVKLNYLGAGAADVSARTNYTFSSVDLGQPSASGLLVIGAGTVGAAAQLDNVYVNGNNATLVAKLVSGGRTAGLFQITGESGTGTVEIYTSNVSTQFHIGLWKLRGVQNTTAHDTDTYTTTPPTAPGTPTATIAVPALGAAIGFLLSDGASAGLTWGGIVEDFEQNSGSNNRSTGASDTFSSAQAALAASVTLTTTGATRLVGASWR